MANQEWEKLRSGNHAALKTLYEGHADMLFRYGCQMTKRTELVQDTIQDLFIYLWQKREQLNTVNNVKSYLITSFRRELVRKLRAEKKGGAISLDEIPFEIELAEEEKDQSELLAPGKLKSAMAALSPRQREVLYLRFESGLEYEEIAEHLDMKYQSVRNLVHRAIKKLRQNIGSLGGWVLLFIKSFT